MMSWAKRSFVALAAVVLTACAMSPVRQANTLEQKAYATYGSFVIAEETVVRLTRPDSNLSRDVQLAMIAGVERAGPVVDQMVIVLRQYQASRAEFESDRAEIGVFNTVVKSLGEWVTQAEFVVGNLQAAVRRGQ